MKKTTIRDWYREAFAEDYLWLYRHRSEKEAIAQVKKAISVLPFVAGQRVLDVACGSGRHMLAFARQGAQVTGLDLSKTLVAEARKRFAEEGLEAVIRRGDMRDLTYRNKFDGATMWFTSLGYFPTQAEDQTVIDGLSRALKSGGWWWIDLPNPAYLVSRLVPQSESVRIGPNGRAHVVETRRLIGRRVEKHIEIHDKAGKRSYVESVRLYRPEQFGAVIRKAGLTTDGILGDYDARALTSNAPRQIWFGHKTR
jgi:ubiquinone/menaquinone biosynthesis C-methylase UbiE